jgi:glycosyltransferase involved in cell wall biosynthesis
MGKKTKITIITVVYNNKSGIKETIKSVLSQVYENVEYIIIDGGSTDGTTDVIKQHQDKINYWVSEPDSGIYDAMNKGVKAAGGEYLYFLNAGDCFCNNEVLKKISKHLDGQYDLIYGRIIMDYGKYQVIKQGDIRKLKWGQMPPHQASFVKRDIFEEVGYFDTSFKCSGDRDFFCKLYKNKYSYKRIKDLIAYFISGGMSSNKQISNKEQIMVLKRHFGSPYWQIHYLKKIVLEETTKRVLKKLKLNNFLQKLIEFNNKHSFGLPKTI